MADKNFLIIAITRPDEYPDEVTRITEILREREADIVHIRKPEWPLHKTEELIRDIPENFHPYLKLHDHFSLVEKYNLAGVHLNSRNLNAPKSVKNVSRSFHTLEELSDAEKYDYVTLSPIFDSISKQGYKSHFNIEELANIIRGKHVVALGGVTPEKIPLLKSIGFSGSAMLGYFFP